jgi:hypothetical protein
LLFKDSKDSAGIVYSASAALASERNRNEPIRRQAGALVRHKSAAEPHSQIAASATGATSAAIDIVITGFATLTARSAITTEADEICTKAIGIRSIWAEATNDRQGAVRAADLGARLPRTTGIAGLTETTIRPDATGEAK